MPGILFPTLSYNFLCLGHKECVPNLKIEKRGGNEMGKTEDKVNRKTRADKKIDVKPTVDVQLYECVSRISHITNTPIKNVGELFCKNGLYSKKVIDHLAKQFRRDYRYHNTLHMGNPELLSERRKKKSFETTRITMRFPQDTYNDLAELAYALDMTISSTASLLLHASVQNTDIVNEYISNYVEDTLDENRKKQLKLVLQFIRKENPYEYDEITLSQLISYIMDNFMDKSRNVKKAVENWLNQYAE